MPSLLSLKTLHPFHLPPMVIFMVAHHFLSLLSRMFPCHHYRLMVTRPLNSILTNPHSIMMPSPWVELQHYLVP